MSSRVISEVVRRNAYLRTSLTQQSRYEILGQPAARDNGLSSKPYCIQGDTFFLNTALSSASVKRHRDANTCLGEW